MFTRRPYRHLGGARTVWFPSDQPVQLQEGPAAMSAVSRVRCSRRPDARRGGVLRRSTCANADRELDTARGDRLDGCPRNRRDGAWRGARRPSARSPRYGRRGSTRPVPRRQEPQQSQPRRLGEHCEAGHGRVHVLGGQKPAVVGWTAMGVGSAVDTTSHHSNDHTSNATVGAVCGTEIPGPSEHIGDQVSGRDLRSWPRRVAPGPCVCTPRAPTFSVGCVGGPPWWFSPRSGSVATSREVTPRRPWSLPGAGAAIGRERAPRPQARRRPGRDADVRGGGLRPPRREAGPTHRGGRGRGAADPRRARDVARRKVPVPRPERGERV